MPSLTPPVLTATLLCAILASPESWATTKTFTTTVTKTQLSSTISGGVVVFGGCMAALTVNPQAQLPNCAAGWVTFSCSGNYNDPIMGYRKLDQAQLALALNKNVSITIDDGKKHNGYCFATRIDLIK